MYFVRPIKYQYFVATTHAYTEARNHYENCLIFKINREQPCCIELLMLCCLPGLYTLIYQTRSTHDLNSRLGKIINYSMPLIYATI